MHTEPRPAPAPVASRRLSYPRLAVILLAVVLAAIVVVGWEDFTSGFTGAYHRAVSR
jgi:hypothetical protein